MLHLMSQFPSHDLTNLVIYVKPINNLSKIGNQSADDAGWGGGVGNSRGGAGNDGGCTGYNRGGRGNNRGGWGRNRGGMVNNRGGTGNNGGVTGNNGRVNKRGGLGNYREKTAELGKGHRIRKAAVVSESESDTSDAEDAAVAGLPDLVDWKLLRSNFGLNVRATTSGCVAEAQSHGMEAVPMEWRLFQADDGKLLAIEFFLKKYRCPKSVS
ncbi:abscisic acid and environmental stress-inducible protein-like [Ctenocephalides felis]|uniref:abscisic acid and environmental stress-inducible protein-like n=1 Tax=Ctenocephalides felis TaxID=7515 RepID=UPI000E6E301E|nr:abscisic acid and environmental stress-inducible protein-like [Ctenocephalides felis]